MNIPNKLNILFSGTSYPSDEIDWRGIFTARLVEALSNLNELNLAVWVPPGKLPANVRDISFQHEAKWLAWLMKQGGIAHLLRTKGPFAVLSVLRLLFYLKNTYTREQNNDVAHINWIQNALPLWGLSTPAVISVLGSDFGLLKLPGMKDLLRMVIKQRKTIIAPNADWMAPVLEQFFGDIAEIRPIPFGVDKRWFTIQKNVIDHDKIHWITVTRITSKKIGNLFNWGKGCFGKNHILHLFGPMQEEITLPEWIVYHGPVSPDDLYGKWFRCCSGFITLSHHDEGRPQVILESMAAGLPIIASDIPAHLDVVKHSVDGWIVSKPQDLRNALDFFNSHESVQRAGQSARSWVHKNIGTWDDCARRFLKAYRSVQGQQA